MGLLVLLVPILMLLFFIANRFKSRNNLQAYTTLFLIAIFLVLLISFFIINLVKSKSEFLPLLIILFFIIIIFSAFRDYLTYIKVGRKESATILRLPKLGFTMHLPSGWQVHPNNPYEFFEFNKRKNWGRVEEYPAPRATVTLREFVQEEIKNYLKAVLGKESPKTGYQPIVSTSSLEISGLEAIEAILELSSIEVLVYIKEEDRVIHILFSILKEDFNKYRPLLSKAIKSIEILHTE